MSTGKIKTLYSDKEKTEALFPRTKTSAISDANGIGLDALMENLIYTDNETVETTTAPLDADTLGGKLPEDYALAEYGYSGKAIALGEIADEDTLTTAVESVYNSMASGETKSIRWYGYPSSSDYSFFGILTKSSANYGSLCAQSAYSKGCWVIKAKYNGTWLPIEWENPPMIAGTEYRTTERYNGKPVYVKLLGCGTMPAASSTKEIEHGTTIADVVDFSGRMVSNGTNPIALPYYFASNNYAYLSVSYNKISLVAGGTALTGYTANVWFKYTKTTD